MLPLSSRHALALSACGIAAGLTLAGCGGGGHAASSGDKHIPTHGGTLDAGKLEQAIRASALKQRGAKATVNCPTAIKVKAGKRFYCVAEVGTKNTPFRVTEKNGKGDVVYKGLHTGQAPLLNGAAISAAIKTSIAHARHVGASVSCPIGIPQQRGLQFVCLATVRKSGTTQFLVTETDSKGHVRYRAQ